MLEVRNLHAYYGKSHILQGVDFTVGDNEIVSILGRNGVGRSTTLKTIMGEPEPHGQILFKNRPIAGLKPYQIARLGIGYVPEERAIFPTLTVQQNLLMGIKPGAKARRWDLEDTWRVFPRLRERAGALGSGPVRWRTADADDLPHADGRPGPHHDRRADRGSGAADR